MALIMGSITGNIMESITEMMMKADYMRQWFRKGTKAAKAVKGDTGERSHEGKMVRAPGKRRGWRKTGIRKMI